MKNNKKIYIAMFVIGLIPFILDIIYTIISVAMNNNIFEIFGATAIGIAAYFHCFFCIIFFGFPIYIISAILLLVSASKLFNKVKYFITLIIGIILVLIIFANAWSFNLKNIFYSIKDLWIIFLIGILLIIYSIIKLKKEKANE